MRRRLSLVLANPVSLLAVIGFGLPALLVFHAVTAAKDLQQMRLIFLRDRAAGIAALLESLPAETLTNGTFGEIFNSDPSVQGIRILTDAAPDPAVETIRSGRQLYTTGEVHSGPATLFRAYIPFHSAGQVRVACIDLNPAAADFLLGHAGHNLVVAAISAGVLLLISLYAIHGVRLAARLEKQRLENQRLAELGAMSAVLAHEIRNPLGTVKGFAQLAAETAVPERRTPLDAIVRECERLEGLVNELLLYGRPIAPVVRSTEWPAVESELAAFARDAIGSRPIEFRSESAIRFLHTDPGLLKQALLNLIRNSVESMPEGQPGSILLRAAEAPDARLLISVEDNGPGLPEAVRARLFAPFVTTKASGTGLGLPISRKFVEALGGTLQIGMVAPHGTRAELCFHGTHPDH